jgi:hypothetical protein
MRFVAELGAFGLVVKSEGDGKMGRCELWTCVDPRLKIIHDYKAVLSVHPPMLSVHPFPKVDYSVPARGVSTYNSC